MPFILIILAGIIFELLEGLAKFVLTDPELIEAYLATQGELLILDSLKDMLMKIIGGIISMFSYSFFQSISIVYFFMRPSAFSFLILFKTVVCGIPVLLVIL